MSPDTAEPKHPLHAMTTYELRDRRRELEHAINGAAPDAPVQALLRAQLADVANEEQDRRRIAEAPVPVFARRLARRAFTRARP